MNPDNSAALLDAAGESCAPMARAKKLRLSLEACHYNGAIVLHCQGRLIFRNEAHALSKTVSEILPEGRRMVVDLAGVESVDSAGLGELVMMRSV
jgi:anti-anti-sigma regulatory factor